MTRNELVEKMLDAAKEAGAIVRGDLAFATMAAALDVALDACLSDPNAEEFDRAISATAVLSSQYRPGGCLHHYEVATGILASRRAALAHVKTVEERVRIKEIKPDNFTRYIVQQDGITKVEFLMLVDAVTYRLGLIQQLKEQP